MAQLPVPEKLNLKQGDRSNNWKIFKQGWQNYETATALSKKSNQQRLATFLTIIGKDGLELYNTFTFDEANENRNIEDVIAKFETYCEPLKNITFERYKFLSRKQQHGESIDEYITALKLLASSCEYNQMQDSMVKDALVLGVTNSQLREALLRETNLDLNKAINLAQSTERAQQQIRTLNNENESNVNNVDSTKNKSSVEKLEQNVTAVDEIIHEEEIIAQLMEKFVKSAKSLITLKTNVDHLKIFVL